jgi:hypothetical protein
VPAPGTTSQLVRAVFQSIMGSHEGVFSAEPAAGDHPRGGLGRPGGPIVGSPTHPVMPNLIVLWKMGPPWGEGRAGARLCPQGLFRALAPPFGTQAGPLLTPSSGLGRGGACVPPAPIAAKPLNQRSSLVTKYSQDSVGRGVEA